MSSPFPALISLTPGARVLVAGGTGIVGSGVVQAVLKQGAKVTVVTRSEERFEALQQRVPARHRSKVSLALGDVTTEKGAKEVFDQSTAVCSKLMHVVAAIRGGKTGWQAGRLVNKSLKQFQAITMDEVTGHFLLMKHFLPYLLPKMGSSYTVVTGYPGGTCHTSGNGTCSSLHCLSDGALRGLTAAARAEYNETMLAVNEFRIKCLVHKQSDSEVGSKGPQYLGHDLVGSAITAVMAAGLRDVVQINSRDDAKEWAASRSGFADT